MKRTQEVLDAIREQLLNSSVDVSNPQVEINGTDWESFDDTIGGLTACERGTLYYAIMDAIDNGVDAIREAIMDAIEEFEPFDDECEMGDGTDESDDSDVMIDELRAELHQLREAVKSRDEYIAVVEKSEAALQEEGIVSGSPIGG